MWCTKLAVMIALSLKIYIGQSDRSLVCRLKNAGEQSLLVTQNASALAEHTMKSGHEIDWCSARVLATQG